MSTIHKSVYCILLCVLVVGVGCEMANPVLQTSTNNGDSVSKTQKGISDPSRYQEVSEGQNAIDSAIELSRKYAALSEEMSALQMEKEKLAVENAKLQAQLDKVLPEAEQAKKELAEANDLLVEMRIELNNWKSDVLGFREEIRAADKIQLEALLKILRVLGGEEVSTETTSAADIQNPQVNEPNE